MVTSFKITPAKKKFHTTLTPNGDIKFDRNEGSATATKVQLVEFKDELPDKIHNSGKIKVHRLDASIMIDLDWVMSQTSATLTPNPWAFV